MSRLKLPAYAKQLMLERRAGRHPLVVHCIFGFKWRDAVRCSFACEGATHPLIALKPEDYAPGLYDFRVLTGIEVALFDQECYAGVDTHVIYDLIGEIARWAADVMVHSAAFETPQLASSIAEVLRNYRVYQDADKNYGWPRWWSADIEKSHGERRNNWFEAVRERAFRARADEESRAGL